MEYGSEILKGYDGYCRKKRDQIDAVRDKDQKALQEKVLIARSLLYRVAGEMVEVYGKCAAILDDKSGPQDPMEKIRDIEGRDLKKAFIRVHESMRDRAEDDLTQFWPLQDALMGMICAGLEDTAFSKWRADLIDAIREVQETEQAGRLPRFSRACSKAEESLDIDLSEEGPELRAMFEPECIYNTLILLVTAIKCYCEMLGIIYKRKKDQMIDQHRQAKAAARPKKKARTKRSKKRGKSHGNVGHL